ncbi:MAG: gliding motility-associated C-terminal domain-containing protein [Cytophagales bacterium]
MNITKTIENNIRSSLTITILFFGLCISKSSFASHIVGGEITLKHLQKFDYKLTLSLYSDLVSGQDVQDSTIYISAFDKKTNNLIQYFPVLLKSSYDIRYDTILCQYISIRNRILTYDFDVTLDSVKYNYPDGFYLVWDRCCRNAGLINIANSLSTGTLFYTEFPPIKTTVNSSPVFALPNKNSYACFKSPFSFDFSATDADGDSLAYKIVVPLNGYADVKDPAIIAVNGAPYRTVSLSNGYTINNLISGTKPLSIDKNGQISFNADRPGYYAFGVQCTEFRNKKPIGLVRRDYQMAILSCMKNPKPDFAFISTVGGKTRKNADTIDVNFERNLTSVTLQTISTIAGQRMDYRYELSTEVFRLQETEATYYSKSNADTARNSISFYTNCCPTACPVNLFRLKVYVTSANNCTEVRYDTITVYIRNKIENGDAKKTYSIYDNENKKTYLPNDTVPISSLSYNGCLRFYRVSKFVEYYDVSATLHLSEPNILSTSVQNLYRYNGVKDVEKDTLLFDECRYDFKCIRFSQPVTSLKVVYTTENCGTIIQKDTVLYYLKGAENQKYAIQIIDRKNNSVHVPNDTLNLQLKDINCLEIVASYYFDSNNININLSVAALNFYNANNPGKNKASNSYLYYTNANIPSLTFCLDKCPTTSDSIIKVRIIHAMSNFCINVYDTSYFYINNRKTINLLNIESNAPATQSVLIGQPLKFKVKASNNKNINISLEKKPDVWNTTFEIASTKGEVEGNYSFTPICENLKNAENNITFVAKAFFDCAENFTTTEISVKVQVRDTISGAFSNVNIVTPNNDNINDYFEISNLPTNNCGDQFESIIIYNRWGSQIFQDTKLDFKWNPANAADGLYYYSLIYNNKTYKSWLMIAR